MTADAFPRIFFPAPWEFSGLFLKIFEQELKQKQAEAERSILLALGCSNRPRETKR